MSRWDPPLWYDRASGAAWRFILIVGAIALIVALLGAIDVVVLPLFLGLLFASVLRPVTARLLAWGARPALASLVAVLLFLGALAGAAVIALLAIGEQWDDIVLTLDQGADELHDGLADSTLLDEGQAQAFSNALQEVASTLAGYAVRGAGAFACVLALADGGISRALAMLAIVVIVQAIEGNLLQPIILGKTTGIHPMVVALIVVGAGAVSGILGVIVAVPIASALTAVGSELRQAGWFNDRRLGPLGGRTPTT
jgi:predicted PurR-regulated permease PerM